MTDSEREAKGPAEIGISYLPHHGELPSLKRMTEDASGFDVFAACEDTMTVRPGHVALVPSGFMLSIPRGLEAQVRPRSGLAFKDRIGILNSPGTIDSDYRGEVKVIIYNFGDEDFVVRRGDRVAQIVFCRLPQVKLVEQEILDGTERGSGGFGHTG